MRRPPQPSRERGTRAFRVGGQAERPPGIPVIPGRLLALFAILATVAEPALEGPDAGVLLADALPPAPAEAVQPAKPAAPRPGVPGQTAAHLAFAAGVVASSMLGTVLVYLPGTLYFGRTGRPEPLVPATAAIPVGALKLAVTYWLLPELYRVGGGTPDIDATRQAMWRLVRWPAIGVALSLALLVTGAALEYDHFGRGQSLMIGAFAGTVLSHAVFDVLSIVGSSQGYRR